MSYKLMYSRPPPMPPISGLVKSGGIWEWAAVLGGGGIGRGGIGGDDCNLIDDTSLVEELASSPSSL